MSLASCLTAIIRRIGGSLNASVSARRDALDASVTKVGGLDASVAYKGCGCKFSATRKGGLRASVGLVCTSSLGEYILWGRDGIIFNVYGDKIYLTRK